MDAADAARRWTDGWSRAWRTEDADGVAALYTEDAVYRSHPFREPRRGSAGARAYAVQAFEEEELVEAWFGEPIAAGDRACVEWWAIVVENGEQVSLAGASMLRFGEDGRVVEQADYWATAPGETRPWTGWGR